MITIPCNVELTFYYITDPKENHIVGNTSYRLRAGTYPIEDQAGSPYRIVVKTDNGRVNRWVGTAPLVRESPEHSGGIYIPPQEFWDSLWPRELTMNLFEEEI